MKKKQYITPSASVVAITSGRVIATSDSPTLKYCNSNEDEGPTVAESSMFAGGLTEVEEQEGPFDAPF
jgi:hypothetical protein